jgi:hypothetical protein
MRLKVFDGRAPQDAARDPAMRVPILAAILVLELSSMSEGESLDFNQLRTKVGVPIAGTIEPDEHAATTVPLARLHRLDAKKLSDDQLLMGYVRAAHYRHIIALRRFADEVLLRPTLEKRVPRQEIYGQLAQIERDPKKAIEYIDLARKHAEAAGQSSAQWDITEMTMQLAAGNLTEADRLMQHIRNDHIREPGVAQTLFQVLVEMGVVRPDGTPTMAPPPSTAAAGLPSSGTIPAAEAGKLWTPDGETAPAAGGKKSVIWTPE